MNSVEVWLSAEATEAFSNAERIIPREPGLSEGQLYHLYASWTDMAFENDNQDTLFHINETLLSLGQERNSDLLIGTSYDGLSDAFFVWSRWVNQVLGEPEVLWEPNEAASAR